MAELRQMFLDQALKYRGVPYAKRYFTPEGKFFLKILLLRLYY